MKLKIFKIIYEMTLEKIESKNAPFHVLYMDLKRRFTNEGLLIQGIKELINDKRINAGHTLNDRYLIPINIESMKLPEKNLNHEIWYKCDCCGIEFDLKETFTCPNCKTHKSENYGI